MSSLKTCVSAAISTLMVFGICHAAPISIDSKTANPSTTQYSSVTRNSVVRGIVVDATGKIVGPFVPGFGTQWSYVMIYAEGVPRLLRVTSVGNGTDAYDPTHLIPSAIAEYYDSNVLFDGVGCTGNAYVPNQQQVVGFAPSVTVGDSAGHGYLYIPKAGLGVYTTFLSMLAPGLVCLPYGPDVTGPLNAAPVSSIVDLSTVFTPPYTVK